MQDAGRTDQCNTQWRVSRTLAPAGMKALMAAQYIGEIEQRFAHVGQLSANGDQMVIARGVSA